MSRPRSPDHHHVAGASPCVRQPREDNLMTTLWHRAYCNWYDHHTAKHPVRAAVWGWTADRICDVADVVGWTRATNG